MISHDVREQEIREAAADWAVRLDAAAAGSARPAELERWLADDPRHLQALQYAQATWDLLGQLGSAQVTAPLVDVRQFPARRRAAPLRWVATAAALVLLLVSVQQGSQMMVPLLADHATGRGEIREVQLPDGSVAQLDTQSAIDLVYSASERRIRLLQGEASFTVAPLGPDEQRPFVVESRGGSTRALGTRFVVGENADEGAWVGVLEHSVELKVSSPADNRLVLREGQAARYDQMGIEPLSGLDVQRASSWQRGVLVFERVPLEQVAQRLNRYRAGWVVIADAQLAQREVSGVFRLDSLDEALSTVTRELHAKRTDLPGVSLIY